jgi:hypothetical protein
MVTDRVNAKKKMLAAVLRGPQISVQEHIDEAPREEHP